jgi:Secretin and TonB N terminus short domain
MRSYLVAALAAALLVYSTFADTETFAFDIPREDLAMALNQIAQQSRIEISYSAELTRGKISPLLKGTYTPERALKILLKGSGLHVRRIVGGALVIEKDGAGKLPAGGQEPTSNSDATVQMREIIVTAAKRAKSARSRFPRGYRGLPWSQRRLWQSAADSVARECSNRNVHDESDDWQCARDCYGTPSVVGDVVPLHAWIGGDSGHCDSEAVVGEMLSLADHRGGTRMLKPGRRAVGRVATGTPRGRACCSTVLINLRQLMRNRLRRPFLRARDIGFGHYR